MVLRIFALASLGLLVCVGTTYAAGSPESPESKQRTERPSDYDRGMKLVETGSFVKARRAFEQAVKRSPKDPDALNMLAYSQRKSGQLDEAIETYKRALELRPRFPQAREYLAEAYLQASLKELATLQSYGAHGASEAAQLVTALKTAADELPGPESFGAKQSW